MAEDLIRQQEIIYSIRPEVVIEIGVARGGGLLFGASMQEVGGITPNVIGVDNVIMPHTRQAIVSSRYSQNISLIEADSDSDSAIGFVRGFLKGKETALMILDSDHSSQHVLTELRAYFDILPVGSMVIVCDTIIDELPPGTFPGRSWSNGFGPGHAIEQFLRETPDAELVPDATADLLITEIRMGVLRKIPTAKLSR
jgi:cephalosporin hydroxylase